MPYWVKKEEIPTAVVWPKGGILWPNDDAQMRRNADVSWGFVQRWKDEEQSIKVLEYCKADIVIDCSAVMRNTSGYTTYRGHDGVHKFLEHFHKFIWDSEACRLEDMGLWNVGYNKTMCMFTYNPTLKNGKTAHPTDAPHAELSTDAILFITEGNENPIVFVRYWLGNPLAMDALFAPTVLPPTGA